MDMSRFPPQARVVAEALKRHGAIIADNGSSWFISGAPDDRWNNDALGALKSLKGSDFEAVDAAGLMLDPNSGAARQPEVSREMVTQQRPGRGSSLARPHRVGRALSTPSTKSRFIPQTRAVYVSARLWNGQLPSTTQSASTRGSYPTAARMSDTTSSEQAWSGGTRSPVARPAALAASRSAWSNGTPDCCAAVTASARIRPARSYRRSGRFTVMCRDERR